MSTLAQDTQTARANTFMFSLSGTNTCRVCVFLVLLIGLFYSVRYYFVTAALKETNLLDVVTPVLSCLHHSFYVQYQKYSCVIVFVFFSGPVPVFLG